MIVKEYCEPFLGEIVNIGIPHRYLDRLFFVTGKLIEINDSNLIIKMKNGIKQIDLKDIVEINIKSEE